MMNKIILKEKLDLELSLFSGQAFRWKKKLNWYYGFIDNKFLKLRIKNNCLEYLCSDDWVAQDKVYDYFGLGIKYNEIFENFDEIIGGDPHFQRTGYIILGPEEIRTKMESVFQMQNKFGIDTQILTPTEASELHPLLQFDDVDVTELVINDELALKLDVNGHNGISGLTSLGSMSTLSVFEADGRPTGTFENMFIENSGETLDREFLVENLRGISWQSYDRSVDVLVSRLRGKLGETPNNTRFIKTIHGVGYKFIGEPKN